MTDILTTAAELFGIERARLCARGGRSQRITQARQAVAWALREAGYTVVEIGDLMGGRDHTTICYATKQADLRARENVDYALKLAALRGGA
jgi:chromosomal replication initiator protein